MKLFNNIVIIFKYSNFGLSDLFPSKADSCLQQISLTIFHHLFLFNFNISEADFSIEA